MRVYKSYLTCKLITSPSKQIVITGGYYTSTGQEGNTADKGASNHVDIVDVDARTISAGT